MFNTKTLSIKSSDDPKEEIDRLISLCSHLSQTIYRIQIPHLSNVDLSAEYIKISHRELLSMVENIEGSALLLESLLAIEQRKPVHIQIRKSRHYYNRDELLQLRQRVTPSLSMQIKNLLDQVVEHEFNLSNRLSRYCSRDIRSIFV